MEELLKKLLESELLDADTVNALKRKISEVETAAENRAAKKFEQTYAEDRQKLIAALDLMVSEGIKKTVQEFNSERKSLNKIAAQTARAAANAEKIAEEKVARKIAALKIMLEENLEKEIKEFRDDRRAERTAVVKVIKEAKLKASKDRDAFVKRGAVVLETIIEDMLGKKMKELTEDIKAARRNDFGRRIFETFSAEFRSTFYNENAEAKKLAKSLSEARRKISVLENKAKTVIESAKSEAVVAKRQVAKLQEQADRQRTMNKLLANLKGDARKQMKVILESQQTASLRTAYKKFLPEVLKPASRKLLENRRPVEPMLELKEGNRRFGEVVNGEPDSELINLRIRAGLNR